MKFCPLPVLLVLPLVLGACERLGIDDPIKLAAMAEAEGKAVGAACRNAGRGLEDCYQRNPKAPKAAVFAGWKDMNDYMAQNKMDIIPPPAPIVLKPEGTPEGEKSAEGEGKPDTKKEG